MSVYKYVCACVGVYVYMCICLCVCICTCICVSMSVCIRVCVCRLNPGPWVCYKSAHHLVTLSALELVFPQHSVFHSGMNSSSHSFEQAMLYSVFRCDPHLPTNDMEDLGPKACSASQTLLSRTWNAKRGRQKFKDGQSPQCWWCHAVLGVLWHDSDGHCGFSQSLGFQSISQSLLRSPPAHLVDYSVLPVYSILGKTNQRYIYTSASKSQPGSCP